MGSGLQGSEEIAAHKTFSSSISCWNREAGFKDNSYCLELLLSSIV